MNEDRLETLEIKVAFQEKAIKELNDIIYAQQMEIDRLVNQVKTLMESGIQSGSDGPANEKPPHY
ncbi:MAG: SlyX family protein [Desulfobacterales bacterium]|nr:SlyX family protein [Desulfobacterales bacterium]